MVICSCLIRQLPSTLHWVSTTSEKSISALSPLVKSAELRAGVSGNSRSRSFPRMEASDSLSRTLGMDFFIPFPFPNFGNGFFSFPSRSRILGIDFFIPFPFPNFGIFFYSRILGMFFFHSLPVPEFWEWFFSIPFLFPNCRNRIIHSRSRSPLPAIYATLTCGNWLGRVRLSFRQMKL